MTKMFCSADEYAYLEKSYNSYSATVEKMKKLKPGSAAAEARPKFEHIKAMFAEALDAFEVLPGSKRTDTITLSVEFQKNFERLKTPKLEFTPIILKETD